MSQFRTQPNKVQQPLGIQQQPSMQQRLQTSGSMPLQQNNIDQQKQFIQARGLQEVSSSSSVDFTAQTGHACTGDWQEEVYQMIKSLKDQYFVELNELYNKISLKLQLVETSQKPTDLDEKMKKFKMFLERTLQFLQMNKSSIQPSMREKLPLYERQIKFIIMLIPRRKPVLTQGQPQFPGQGPTPDISQFLDLLKL